MKNLLLTKLDPEKLVFAKVELWVIILGLLVLLPLTTGWAIASVTYHLFPYSICREVYVFVRGDEMGQSTLLQRIERTQNPMATWTRRFDVSLTDEYRVVRLEGLDERRAEPQLRLRGPQPDYRLLVGVFGLEESLWGAILLNSQGAVCHQWMLSGGDLSHPNGPEGNLYGAAITPDGSIIYCKQELGKGIIKRDLDSNVLWINEGTYHHVVSPDAEFASIWTFGRGQTEPFPTLVNIDVASGRTIRTIPMEAVYENNPHIHIFDHRTRDQLTNMPHPNDIEVLSPETATAFPEFEPGDLAINYHMSNLVFVLDPDTLVVKFWYTGAGDGAHDVDFHPDGTMSIFNNNFRAEWHKEFRQRFSDIVTISPSEHRHWVSTTGEMANLYSHINGRHQIWGNHRVVFDCATQGRFTELDTQTGEVTFDFVNVYSRDRKTALHVSESFVLAEDFFDLGDRKLLPTK